MNKTKRVAMICMFSCVLAIMPAQYLLHNMNYAYTSHKGDIRYLEDISIESEVFPILPFYSFEQRSPESFSIQVKSGEFEYKLQEQNNQRKKTSLKSILPIIVSNPIKDESRLEISEGGGGIANSYQNGESRNFTCDVYNYEQDEAKVYLEIETQDNMQNVTAASMIETGLKLYPDNDDAIFYREEHCKYDSGEAFPVRILSHYQTTYRLTNDAKESIYNSYESSYEMYEFDIEVGGQVFQTKDEEYYTMPQITPNMEGIADIYRLHSTLTKGHTQEEADQLEIEKESIHQIPIERGTVGFLDHDGTFFYTYLWKDGVMNIIKYDAKFQAIESTNFAFTLENLDTIKSFTSNQVISLVGKNMLYAFDRNSMKLINQTSMEDSRHIEDVYYKNDRFYVAKASDEVIDEYTFALPYDAMISVYENDNLVYEGEFNVIKSKEVETENMKYNFTNANRRPIRFVRDQR